MKIQPLLYYSYSFCGKCHDMLFAEYDAEVNIPFCSTYFHDLSNDGEKIIDSVWYDPYLSKMFQSSFVVDVNIAESYVDIDFCSGGMMYAWLVSPRKSVLIKNLEITEISNEIFQSDIQWFQLTNELHELFENNALENNRKIGIMKSNFRMLFQQYNYRYQLSMDGSNGFDGIIENILFDGTHDKLHDGGLMKYHEAGRPKKLAIKWHIKKIEYSAYFWFDEIGIRTVFDKFYGAHPETKTDFIIRIDAENQKYELALYRYGLKEPHVIPEDVYQVIVFKNKFEDYRSDNYNQESGAWIW